ncbi:hypothetical protein [Cylindrospermopsis raciborskii]|uniref:hypothetical protein n=1 Tax=Cylindrospermopsis raciborskii TaxID=77022 RepID=UPI0015E86F19|nr:hypothetical protein [Cylindrospermopsis raciborskii]
MKIAVNLHMFLTKFKQYYEAISTAIAVRDNWHSVTKCDVLLVGHVNDRGYRYKNQSYAQLLDSLGT